MRPAFLKSPVSPSQFHLDHTRAEIKKAALTDRSPVSIVLNNKNKLCVHGTMGMSTQNNE